MPTTAPPAKSPRRKKEVAEEFTVKRRSERVAAHLASDISSSGPVFKRVVSRKPVQVADGARAAAEDDSSPDALEAAALLQRINADLAVEEALVAQLMKQRGL